MNEYALWSEDLDVDSSRFQVANSSHDVQKQPCQLELIETLERLLRFESFYSFVYQVGQQGVAGFRLCRGCLNGG